MLMGHASMFSRQFILRFALRRIDLQKVEVVLQLPEEWEGIPKEFWQKCQDDEEDKSDDDAEEDGDG